MNNSHHYIGIGKILLQKTFLYNKSRHISHQTNTLIERLKLQYVTANKLISCSGNAFMTT